MSITDDLKNGAIGLQSYKLRALLTTLGIIFGVSAVISMLAIGAGARREALESIKRIGIDNILVKKGKAGRISGGLSEGDMKGLERILPQVRQTLSARRLGEKDILAGDVRVKGEIFGISGDLSEVLGFRFKGGRNFTSLDFRRYNKVCIIGSELKRELFGFSSGIGKRIRVQGGQVVEVIGTLEQVPGGKGESSSILFNNPNRNVYIPLSTLYTRFTGPWDRGVVDEGILHLAENDNMFETAHVVREFLKTRHHDEEDFTLVVPEALLMEMQKTQRIFSLVMGFIAGISLLVGGIGIMNIMLATVTERTREIGIRRAVGATRRDIMAQFLAESVLISVTGGAIGVIAGVLLSTVISKIAGWETIITPQSIVIAVAVSVATGLVFGVYPAGKAARLNPIEALRYE